MSSTRPLAQNGRIELAFDRLLSPDTTTRQAFVLTDVGGNPPQTPPLVAYDPVARIVTLTPTSPLDPNLIYRLTIVAVTSGPNAVFSLRAIDGTTLDPATPMPIEFAVSGGDAGRDAAADATVSAVPTSPAPTIDFCRDLMPIFAIKCTASICHGGSTLPAAGLLLDTPTNIVATALGRVAQGSNTGPASAPAAPGRIFGVDMPIIDPGPAQAQAGNPANSWLMYKLLMAVPPACSSSPGALPCDGGSSGDAGDSGNLGASGDSGVAGDAGAPPTAVTAAHDLPQCQSDGQAECWHPLSDSERATLSNLVPGREMPFPTHPAAALDQATEPLTVDELERVSLWIAEGAAIPPTCP